LPSKVRHEPSVTDAAPCANGQKLRHSAIRF
jgi:hypothetical protein